jgi:hypothetical protein
MEDRPAQKVSGENVLEESCQRKRLVSMRSTMIAMARSMKVARLAKKAQHVPVIQENKAAP